MTEWKWKVNKITIPWSSESEEIWIVGRGTELRNEIEEHNESAIFRERERESERQDLNGGKKSRKQRDGLGWRAGG